jgi:hypothetical protein
MTDTLGELCGFVGDCLLCDEPIMDDDAYVEMFDGFVHAACDRETQMEMADYEERGYE